MDEKINQLTEQIIGAGIEVHKALGPGLLESVYQKCFCHELGLRDISYQVEVPIPLEYKGLELSNEYRVDVVVEDLVVVECDRSINDIHATANIGICESSTKVICVATGDVEPLDGGTDITADVDHPALALGIQCRGVGLGIGWVGKTRG